MAALSEQKVPFNPDAVVQETDKLALLGKITQKLECRPIADKVIIGVFVEMFLPTCVLSSTVGFFLDLYGFEKRSHKESSYPC